MVTRRGSFEMAQRDFFKQTWLYCFDFMYGTHVLHLFFKK